MCLLSNVFALPTIKSSPSFSISKNFGALMFKTFFWFSSKTGHPLFLCGREKPPPQSPSEYYSVHTLLKKVLQLFFWHLRKFHFFWSLPNGFTSLENRVMRSSRILKNAGTHYFRKCTQKSVCNILKSAMQNCRLFLYHFFGFFDFFLIFFDFATFISKTLTCHQNIFKLFWNFRKEFTTTAEEWSS